MNLIELQPDDVLVLRTPAHMSKDERDIAVCVLRSLLTSQQRVLILDDGQALDVIRVAVSGKVETNDIGTMPSTATPEGVEQLESFQGQVREVQHIDVPEGEPAGIPPHVWLYRNMLTDLQALAPLGRDETNGQYAVAVDQLTDEQRAIPHVAKQLAWVERVRVEVVGLNPED